MLYDVAVSEVQRLVAMPGQKKPKPRERIVFGPKTIAAPSEEVLLLLVGKEMNMKDLDPADLEVTFRPFRTRRD